MKLQSFPIRTPCCGKLAIRTVITAIHLDGGLAEIGKLVARSLQDETLCPHCAQVVDRTREVRIKLFPERMRDYIFTGIPRLVARDRLSVD
jgi:hypothetical protein